MIVKSNHCEIGAMPYSVGTLCIAKRQTQCYAAAANSWATFGRTEDQACSEYQDNPLLLLLFFPSLHFILQEQIGHTPSLGLSILQCCFNYKTSPPQFQSQEVVCIRTPRMFPQRGYYQVDYQVVSFIIFMKNLNQPYASEIKPL